VTDLSIYRRPDLTWNLAGRRREEIELHADWPQPVTPAWAWGGSTGRGVRVCVVDSGVEDGHPMVGPLHGSTAVVVAEDGTPSVEPVPAGDTCGHGTACASIIRRLAPDCELHSVRVLGPRYSSSGAAFVAGLRWAVEQGFDVVSLSLSTTRRTFAGALREIADEAYFRRTLLVASAHNSPVESFPWRFSSVLSVGSHGETDASLVLYNPTPPVEFFAHGTDVEVGWLGGGRTRSTGNSFATPHVAGYCALVLGKHAGLTPFQVKTILYLTAANVRR
jgi:subtilisin family serine protease